MFLTASGDILRAETMNDFTCATGSSGVVSGMPEKIVVAHGSGLDVWDRLPQLPVVLPQLVHLGLDR